MFRLALIPLLILWITPATGYGQTSGDTGVPEVAPIVVRTAHGPALFRVADLQASSSSAWRENQDRADKQGIVPAPSPGYEIRSRVVVKANDEQALASIVADHPTWTLSRLANLDDYWLIDTLTVQSALEAADLLADQPAITSASVEMHRPMALRQPTDPHYPNQWHLNNTELPIADVNAEPAWDLGVTGVGVTIGIVEWAWQHDHPDLAANFNEEATQTGGSLSYHATACAGVAGAVAYNNEGCVGLAYGAQLSGQLTGTDAENAIAFAYRNDLNDIKSNSWGPTDNGTITYLTEVEHDAIVEAVTTGRNGLGTIIVWAAGNGGYYDDRVEYDPYASSRYTLAIGAIGDQDYRSDYNETGASMLAVAHSSGNTRKIFSTYGGSGYTAYFGGTSAASPLAAGAIALMLEANPSLTWRDVQHVLINSARQCDATEADWTTNAAGHLVNHNYGFGAVDAYAAVLLAQSWENVGPEVTIETPTRTIDAAVPDDDITGLTRTLSIYNDVRIESVELVLNVETEYVGDLRITLTSPGGTTAILAKPRSDSNDNYVDYVFTSLRSWDEHSAGDWTVTIADEVAGNLATWQNVQLRIYGTHRVGDMNCDMYINFDDIDGFVLALSNPTQYAADYPDCDADLADIDGNNSADFNDIDPFVELLAGTH